MKRFLFVLAALGTLVTALPAEVTSASDTAGPDWHYRWHVGHWWYWMPESKTWMVWTNSTWIPYSQFADGLNRSNRGQAVPYTAAYRSYGAEEESGTAESAYSRGSSCPTTYPSSGSGGNYAGYGWSWGPGTAYRDGPGRRF